MGIQVFTDFDLLGPSDNVTFDTADYIPLEVLEGNENARSCISRAYASSRDPIQNVRGHLPHLGSARGDVEVLELGVLLRLRLVREHAVPAVPAAELLQDGL
jgi:hypothetical protein